MTCARRTGAQRGFYRMLDTMLFRAAEPDQRYRMLERFYRLPEPLIGRFYAGRSTLGATRLRILAGQAAGARSARAPRGGVRCEAAHEAQARCVIGAGFGGLALAIRLQSAGIDTTVVEARDKPGGRAYFWERDGFTFDAGPTVITDPACLQELWALTGPRHGRGRRR